MHNEDHTQDSTAPLRETPPSDRPNIDGASIYPTPSDVLDAVPTPGVNAYTPIGMTRSQMVETDRPYPVGVFIIAGFTLLGFLAGLFDSSQNSNIYTLLLLIDLLVAVGLMVRLEAARKAMLWLSGLTLGLTLVSIVMLFGAQRRYDQSKVRFETAVNAIDKKKLSDAQNKQLALLRTALDDSQKQTGKAITFSYAKLALTGVESAVVLYYLTRPRVMLAFRTLEK